MGMEFDINVNLPQKKIAIKKININLLGVHNVLKLNYSFLFIVLIFLKYL